MKHYLHFLLFFVCSISLIGQNTQKWKIIDNSSKNAIDLVENRKNEWGLGEKDALIRANEIPKTDNLGFKHYRYQQTYENVPIEGAEWFVHEKNGIAKTANGNLVSALQLSTLPNLSEQEALQYALNTVNAEVWAWEDDFLESVLQEENPIATYYPTGELVIFSPDLIKGNASVESYRLAYKFEVFAISPFTQQEVFVDAHNGELITSFGLTCHADVAASGNAHYSCENPVDITAENMGSFYRLHENGRGNGIHTRSSENTWSTPNIDISSIGDTFFDEDEDAVAVHYALEKTYDYLLEKHGRNSIDDNGYKLKAWVHYGNNWNNAMWLSGFALFGDGDNAKYSALTSIDIVAHEIAHGLTARTAGLRYSYESGALNESFSDIFGTLVEFYAEPACADWLIGEDVVVQNGKIATRNMSNPKDITALTQQPNTYGGEYWELNNVHRSSGVLNYWFYLIANGGSGTNDNDLDYTVLPLDIDFNTSLDKAGKIAYRMLTTYLTTFSQYADARAAAIQATQDLYGADSNEMITVTNAFCAVGLGDCVPNPNSITLTAPNGGEVWQNSTTENITWTSTGEITSVNISLSINSGASWQTLATATENDGSHEIVVPNFATTQAMIRIENSEDVTVKDVSNAVFVIQACNVASAFESSAVEVCENESISFTNTSFNATAFEWYIDSEMLSTNTDFVPTFSDAETYFVRLRAINGVCVDEYTEIITVYEMPTAAFTYAQNDTTINCYATNANAMTYSWTIDNASVGTASTLEYAFSEVGIYDVCLNVSSECSNDSFCESVNVSLTPPNECGIGEESWRQYLNGNVITALLEVEDDIFVGTNIGLVKINRITDETTFFNTANSELSNNDIRALLKSSSGEIFIGTWGGGLAKFDGVSNTGWTIFDASNSDFPDVSSSFLHNVVSALLENSNGDIFVGTNHGLAKFDGVSNTGWTIFDTANSELPSNNIRALVKSSSGDIFIGNYWGFAKFDGINTTGWTIFNESNSAIPDNQITCLLENNEEDIFASRGRINDFFVSYNKGFGLLKFDSTSNSEWVIYTTENSDLPHQSIGALLQNQRGQIFVGTANGLAKFDGNSFNDWTNYLTNNAINCLLETSNGEIFVGTDGGLFVLTLASPKASFIPPSENICVNSVAHFVNTSTNASSYQWQLDGSNTSTTTNLNHTFTEAGEYNITLKAFDPQGCEDTYTQNITVYNNAADLNLAENIAQCQNNNAVLEAGLNDMDTYSWHLNETEIGTTASITATQSGTYTLSVTDMCGNTNSDTINVIIEDDCVWPGDTNYDYIVNNKDLLPIGLGFGDFSFSRPNASLNWQGQACQDWENVQEENGINYKHIDTNVDGIIDQNDATAITANYGKTHNSFIPTFNNSNSLISLETTLVSGSNFTSGTTKTLIIDLVLNENEDNQNISAYGLAFDLEYFIPPAIATINNVSVNFTDSWLGSQNDLLTIWKHLPEQNKIELGLTRMDMQNALGKGRIGEVIVEIDIEPITLDEIAIDFMASNIDLVLSNNTFVPVGENHAIFLLTSESCDAPTNLHESQLSCDTVTLKWNAMPDAEAYILAGRKQGGTPKVFLPTQDTLRTFTSGLQPNTTYEWSVKTKCNGLWTNYAAIASFTTPTCKNSTYEPAKDPFFTTESDQFLSEISLYPNPAKNNLHIHFMSFENKNTAITVTDILGKTVLVEKMEVLQGENNIQLDIKDLQSGTYFLEIENGFEQITQKFMVW